MTEDCQKYLFHNIDILIPHLDPSINRRMQEWFSMSVEDLPIFQERYILPARLLSVSFDDAT
jgi:hypothetical protein